MLKNYEEARNVFREFSSNEGHYKTDVAKTLEYMEENYMYRLTLSSISANVNLSSSQHFAGFLKYNSIYLFLSL